MNGHHHPPPRAHSGHVSHEQSESPEPREALTKEGAPGRGGPDEHVGHDRHEGHSPEMFRDKFWLSLLMTAPVVVWSEHIEMLLGYDAPSFAGSNRIPAALGTGVF